jgi:NADH-quinone oxidoreductase subunit N
MSVTWLMILPELIVIVSALALLLIGAFQGNDFTRKQIRLGMLALGVALGANIMTMSLQGELFSGMLVINRFTDVIKALLLLTTVGVLYLSLGFYRDSRRNGVTEFPVLVLLAVAGMMIMVSSNHLLAFYVGLELQSLSLYVLAALHRQDSRSSESGMKYFVLGSLSSGLILYGISLIYGFTGSLSFDAIAQLTAGQATLPIGTLVGLIFVLIGMCFKVSAVPFHMWTPDVYEGAPTPVTAFFAVVPKIAGLTILVRFLYEAFGASEFQWQQIIIFVSAASMIVGALGALHQNNIKRLLAYSSIGHVGFALMAIATHSAPGIKGLLLYLAIYSVMSLGVFACIMMFKVKGRYLEKITDYAGLAKVRPWYGMVWAILMFSMAGIPPFAGFFGKFFVFMPVIEAKMYGLAIIGALSSVVSAFYYLRVVKVIYFDEPVVDLKQEVQLELRYASTISALLNLVFLFIFVPVLKFSADVAQHLFR